MSEFDQALERLHLCGFEYADGHPNYGPMAVEALESLGHAALIPGLIDVSVPRLPVLAEGQPLCEDECRGARGRLERAVDWLARYEQALVRSSWKEVLAEAFAPWGDDLGACRIGLHGLVRLGHAARGLAREDSRARRRELAFALAYLAASSEPLDGTAGPDAWVLRAQAIPAEAVAIGELISAVCLQGAECYLADAGNRLERSFGVVAPGALRFLIPHLPASESKRVLVSLLSRVGDLQPVQEGTRVADEPEDFEVVRCAENPNEIRYRAACSVHEHAIVMAEACLREEALQPGATLLRAAADAALRLSPPGYRDWR